MRFFISYIFLYLPYFLLGQILPTRPATALNKVVLYPDTTFFAHSNTFYEEGTLFEVIGETRYEYEDEAQNQKFKWYQVKTPDDKTGWIFGDGIAVIVPESDIIPQLKAYHLKSFNFSEELGRAIVWLAYIEGKDNFHKEDHLNPLYKEFYLVITSQLGKSAHLQYAASSAMGTSELSQFLVKDLNDDSYSEILFVKSSLNNGNNLENRTLEIYSFQAGSVSKVFEERMTLTYQKQSPSPALFKFVEISKKIIRVAYVDYLNCKNYSLMLPPNGLDKTHEKCLEYVTYSFVWSPKQNKYLPIYEESRTYVKGQLGKEKGFLRAEPSYLSGVVEKLAPFASLKIIQHFEKTINYRGEKKMIPYLYVQSATGKRGYIHAKDIQFKANEHSSILNRFYENPPLNKGNWKNDANFLSVKIDDGQVIITKKE